MRLLTFMIVLVFSSALNAATLSDMGKEKRWASQIVDDLIDGEAVWLEVDGHKFLGIYTAAKGKSKGGVLLGHGTGAHPNWAQVIYPLRVRLAEQGWDTLSIQLPILANDAKMEEYIPLQPEASKRYAAGVDFLKSKGDKSITMIGHSSGALYLVEYLAKNYGPTVDPAVAGAVVVGVTSRDDPARNTLDELTKIKIRILDIYGDVDEEPGVVEMAPRRLAQAKKAPNPDYKQVQIKGSNHFHDGNEDKLTKIVLDWMSKK